METIESNGDPRKAASWKVLENHAAAMGAEHLRDLLSANSGRAEALTAQLGNLRIDFTRARATSDTVGLLLELATQRKLRYFIDQLFAGAMVNNTEGRAALHTSLRSQASSGPVVDGVDIAGEVSEQREKFLRYADSVRTGARTGHSGKAFKTVINIGIGGSDLGPRFVASALGDRCVAPDVRFVAALDRIELREALQDADPETTLIIVCSKTFATLETLTNAEAARDWLRQSMSNDESGQHFAAISVNATAMDEFRVPVDARFAMWDWVGGRYSVWSAVGLAAAIEMGPDPFREFLQGAADMDAHFREADFAHNIPVLHGLLAVWHQNFCGLNQRVVLPYDGRLAGLPDYLQQLWMESLGKSVRRDGASAGYPTGGSLWGGAGSPAQHSFAQWLHQGSAKATVDYIGTANGPNAADSNAHLASLANLIAQAEVLARGHTSDPDDKDGAHRRHPGNRPSTLILLESLTPASLGALIALYEHSVYVQSVIWGINPFDQFGVEQGKRVAREYADSLAAGDRASLPAAGGWILDWWRG